MLLSIDVIKSHPGQIVRTNRTCRTSTHSCGLSCVVVEETVNSDATNDEDPPDSSKVRYVIDADGDDRIAIDAL